MNEPEDEEIWLIRHGETEWSASGRHTGRTDVPLSEVGEAQAKSLRSALSSIHFDHIRCSPLKRSVETCRLAGLEARAILEPDLMEWDYGEYEGRTTPEIKVKRPEWSLWKDGAPGGETPEDVAERVTRVLRTVQLASRSEDRSRTLLFSHAHVLRALGARWVGLPPSAGALLYLGTASLSVLGREHEDAVFKSWNCAKGGTAGRGQNPHTESTPTT